MRIFGWKRDRVHCDCWYKQWDYDLCYFRRHMSNYEIFRQIPTVDDLAYVLREHDKEAKYQIQKLMKLGRP